MAYFEGGDDKPGMISLLDFVNTKMLQSVLPCYWRHISVKAALSLKWKIAAFAEKNKTNASQ